MPNKKWIYLVCSIYVAALLLPAIAGAAAPTPNFLWWKFDDGSGTVAKDSSGKGRDGTITGATWIKPGAGGLGSCLNFTGSNTTVVNVSAGTALNGLSAITVSMWIKSRETNSDKGFIDCESPSTANDDRVTMRYDAAGATYGGTNILKMGVTSTSGLQQLEASNGLQTTEWQHVAMTWKGGVGIKFYSNGKLNTPTGAGAVNTGTISGNTTLIIGQGGKDASSGWNGFIDDVRIYDYDLTDAQVADLLSFVSADAASAPSPALGATDVPRDTTLSWIAAASAQKHNVYLGTDFADVNNASATKPLNVLVSTGQTGTTFTPLSPLQYGKTYYWRVDEVGSSAVTKGDIWSFTVEPYAYPITKVTATASSSAPGMGPENTVNGSGLNSADQHGTDGTTMWLSGGVQPNWIQFAFDKTYKLSELWVWNSNQMIEPFIGFGAKGVKIEYSVDGTTWTQLQGVPQFAQATGLATYASNTTVNFGGVLAKYVKLTINSQWGAVPQAGLSEVRFFSVPVQARSPVPATGATGVNLDATLNWRPGREAASHKVYFGTDPNAVTNGTAAAKTVTDHSYSPSSLILGTTYYWRVDEVNAVTYPGDVWSFTTAAYAVVDDFESYNDTDNRIYDTWVDGFGTSNNGSQVGYAQAPFAEQTIIHGGKQSLPLNYNNTGAITVSEAVRTLASPQNWTASGIKSLSLYFQGKAGNGGQLYLKINNLKVSYNGNAGDIAKPAWLPWNIDLSTVGGSVTNVTKLTIGVEGSGAKGIVYIDDIRLYPTTPVYITPADPGKTNLLALYALEGNANDTSGHGLNGTLKQAVFAASGRTGGGSALQLSAVGYVDLGNPPLLDFGTVDWSVSAWYKNTMTGNADANKGTIYSKGGDSTGGKRYALIMSETTSGVVTLVTDDDVTKYVTDSKSVTNDNQWHFVVGQRAGTALQIYIDGQLEGTSTIPATYNLSGTSQHDAYIGAMTNNTDGSLYKLYNGLLDDVRVYNRALSQGEILWLMGQTTPVAKPF